MNVCFLYSEVRSSEKRVVFRPGFRPGKMRYVDDTASIDTFAMRNDLTTVGELYDFLCEHKLLYVADFL